MYVEPNIVLPLCRIMSVKYHLHGLGHDWTVKEIKRVAIYIYSRHGNQAMINLDDAELATWMIDISNDTE